jgi:hypothetical protein
MPPEAQLSKNSQELAEMTLAIMRASDMPECTKERYCDGTGVAKFVLQGWVNKGLIPTVKRGKYRLINLAAITAANIMDMGASFGCPKNNETDTDTIERA